MPMYEFRCLNQHSTDLYCASPDDKGCRTAICEQCGETMGPVLAFGQGLCFYEEGRGQWIENLADKPVYVTSHEQHKRLMREHKVEWATKGRGMPGQWS